MKAYPVKFRPIPMKRIWGGHRLKTWFGATELDEPIGEYWVLSGHPNGTSVVVNGEFAGKSLVELIELNPDAYLGRSPQPRFPLLIKFLEATADLSVQIHPDDDYAQQNEGDYGKTEAWYILDCQEDGRVNYGHRFQSREEYFAAVREHRVQDYLCYQPIAKDQVVFVPSRTLHALLAGTVVIEVQQTSDVTYRVYDWDRVDDSGNPRELHIEKAADVMQYGGACHEGQVAEPVAGEPVVIERSDFLVHERLLSCAYFTLERLKLRTEPKDLQRGNESCPDILIVVDGCAALEWEGGRLDLGRGDTVLVPASLSQYRIIPQPETTLLRTYY
jgi:mannose-6-phosphate isomerase